MGCCASKQQAVYIDIPRVISATDVWALRQKSFLGSCKLLPYTAACPASYPYQCLTRVVLGEQYLFAALWEGHGGAQAARYCIAHCYELLQETLKATADPCQALQQAIKLLDKAYLASPQVPDLVKASVGATGVMLLLDTQSNRCYVARLGKALPFTAASKGAFSTATVDVKPLASFGSPPDTSRSSSRTSTNAAQQQQQQPGNTITSLTSAIGFGYGKSDKLRKLWLQHMGNASRKQVPHITTDCEVDVTQLSQGDDNLVIAAEGLLQVCPPKEIAVMLQHFNAGKLNEAKGTYCSIKQQQQELRQQQKQQEATSGRDRSRPAAGRAAKRKAAEAVADGEAQEVGELANPANVASIVMHHAMAKSLDKHNLSQLKRHQQQQQHEQQHEQQQQPGKKYVVNDGPMLLSYDDLTYLPMRVDTEAFRPMGSDGAEVKLPVDYPTGGLSKADVHGDMGLVVIALSWPRSVDSLQAGPTITPLRPGMRGLSRRPDAEWRWMLLRTAVKSHLAYRRLLRTTWWRLVEDTQTAAEAAARKAEVHAWKTQGAALKINRAGAVSKADTSGKSARAHQTASSKASLHQPITPPSKLTATSSFAGTPTATPGRAAAAAAVAEDVNTGGSFSSNSSTHAADTRLSNPGNMPDVAARSARSGGGAKVAAAVAAFNSAGVSSGSQCKGSPGGSAAPSFRSSGGSSAAKAPRSRLTELSVTPLNTQYRDEEPEDTASDLDSPAKAVDSPSKLSASAWATPPGARVLGIESSVGGRPLTPNSGLSSAGSGYMGRSGPGSGSVYSKQGLSLRNGGRGAAASPATPEASKQAAPSRSSPGTGAAPVGSGRKSSQAGVAAGSSRVGWDQAGTSRVQARRDRDSLSLRVARKPAAPW